MLCSLVFILIAYYIHDSVLLVQNIGHHLFQEIIIVIRKDLDLCKLISNFKRAGLLVWIYVLKFLF